MKTLTIKNQEVLLDDEDYEKVAQHSWYITNTGYVMHKCRKWTAYLHRFVLDYDGPLMVDHVNTNKLDNQKCNLQLVTQKENQHNRRERQVNNTTGFTGVCNTRYGFQAYINVDGKRKHLGYYVTAEDANDVRQTYKREHNITSFNP